MKYLLHPLSLLLWFGAGLAVGQVISACQQESVEPNPSTIKAFHGNIEQDDVVRPKAQVTYNFSVSAEEARRIVQETSEKEKVYSIHLLLRDIHEAATDMEYSLTQDLRSAGITPKNLDSAISQLKALGYQVQADDTKIVIYWGEEN